MLLPDNLNAASYAFTDANYFNNEEILQVAYENFDSTVYNSQSDVALTLPTGDEWRFATGAQYQITPQSNIGAAVSYLHMQSSHVQSPSIYQGSYDNPYLWFASVNYSYQF